MKKHDYSHILSSVRIGSMTLRNRMAVTAMGVSFGEPDGHCGERIIRYHEEQAKGGVGLIITGVAGVAWPVGGNEINQIAISDDRFLPGLKKLVEAAHAHGAKIAPQLHHGGLVAMMDMLEGRPMWAPSLPEPSKGDFAAVFLPEEIAQMKKPDDPTKMPEIKVMTTEDIALVVQQFADAADRAKRAGFDGAEIHGGHGYLLSSFLYPHMNKRTDDYGGSRENRIRFLLEVIRAVRERVGPDFPLWVKLDSREVGRQGGLTVEDACWNAQQVEAAGADAITVSAYHNTDIGTLHSGSHTPQEPALNLPFAGKIKKSVSIPVLASGRVEPEVGDRAIADGTADIITMGRKLLADPHLPRKLAEGRAEDIRPCIYCYTCISNIYYNQPTRCAVNPETGFEHLHQDYLNGNGGPGARRHFAIVGGGPAGMEAARRLSGAGHRVTLFEKGQNLGGTLRFAAIAYDDNERILDWLEREVRQTATDIRLRTEATAETLQALAADVVLVAPGAIRALPDIPGAHMDHVFSGDDMRRMILGESSAELKRKTGWLTRAATKIGAATGMTDSIGFIRKASRQWMPLGKEIVIIGGELVGLELAEFLVERGRTVTVVDNQERFGRGLQIVRRMRVLEELTAHGTGLFPGAEEIRIEADAVAFRDRSGAARRIPADHVIVAQGAEKNTALADRLRGMGMEVKLLGDGGGVGYIEGAIRGAADATYEYLN